MTLRGQILVSRTDDDLPNPALRVSIQNVPVCTFKASPCVPAPRAHVFQHVRVVPAYTGRFACTHGGVLNPHTGVFSVPHHTAHTHHDHNHSHSHNDTHHRPHQRHHMHSHTQHHTETQTERDREEKTEKRERDKTRQDGREDKIKEKRR